MAIKRVIAHFMHEFEQNAARQLLSQAEETESFVIGSADDTQIATLREQGLIVEEIPVSEPPAVDGDPRRAGSFSVGRPRGGFVENAEDFPRDIDFYKVYLNGPLLESQRDRLQVLDVSPIEFFPPNSFSARLSIAQVQDLRNESYVTDVVRYATPAVKSKPATKGVGRGVPQLGSIKTYDVLLHLPDDLDIVVDALRDRNTLVVQAKGRKIRIQALEDDPLLDDLRSMSEVFDIEEYTLPKLFNDAARQLLRIDNAPVPPGLTTTNLFQTGTGQIVGVADTGIDDTHPDLVNRLIGAVGLGRPGDHSDPNGHGTHVAGSVAGDGSASGGVIRGTAPGASLFFQSLLDARGELGGLPLNLADLFEEAYRQGARIHNNSWGANTEARYTFNSNEVDEYVDQNRDMLIVIAAGNDGDASGTSQRVQPGFTDWLSVGSPATAKNALTVGASRSNRTTGGLAALTYGNVWSGSFPVNPSSSETVSGDPTSVAEFSSRGPCDDERIKPDVVAPGTDIVSAKSRLAPLRNFWGPDTRPEYAYNGGTSMASPLVAGCAALVRQYYIEDRNLAEPSAALLRATLVNGTKWLTGRSAVAEHPTLPNFHQGFGGIDMGRTIPNAAETFDLVFIDSWKNDPLLRFVRTGQRFQFAFNLPAASWLRLCLVYTDSPGRSLQNDLDLTLEHRPAAGPATKWVGNQDAVANQLLKTPDRKNNVEVIRLEAAQPGRYLIKVSAYNIPKPISQDFALVLTAPSIQNFGRI
ncbi:S8 family serine peptidase [Larkinella humicola]|uniref:S8 family serine peptidase n=1 Tax=Larkinella humicola TaxID=2607654 RepID=A0A5N1J459_9BACT|nr:S8 family serine peptidase [Larkinella humicola]KAA9345480.1 S8 family serine peptidase [Larkinella humicola]